MKFFHPYRMFTLLLLLSLVVLPAAAQEFAFRPFTVMDGLISNYVTVMEQDSKGYLWIGTDEGFSIYDGHQFSNVRPPSSMRWGYVNSFLESTVSPEVMWIATNGGGLLRYSGGTFTQVTIDTLDAANRVNGLYEDGTGTVWCTTDNGLYRLRNGTASRIPIPFLPSREVIQVTPVGPDHLWISSPFGLLSIDRRTDRVQFLRQERMEGTNRQILHLPDSSMTAVVFRNAVVLYRGSSVVQRLSLPRGYFGNSVVDGNGTIWTGGAEYVQRISTDGGTLRIVGAYDRNSGLPVNDVSCIASDREDNLWFGTAGKGLVRLHDHDNFLLQFSGMTSRGTTDGADGWWVPTINGLYHLAGNPPTDFDTLRIPFEQSEIPVALQMAGRDTLWCTTFGAGIASYRIHRGPGSRVTLSRIFHRRPSTQIPKIYSVVLFKDSRGMLWCSVDGYGVMVIDTRRPGDAPRIFRNFHGVKPTTIAAFAELPDGRVFAGGIGSSSLLEFGRNGSTVRFIRSHQFDTLISPYGIRSLAASPEGSLWIGTRYDGLIRWLPDGTLKQFTYEDGLHSMQVLSLYADANALWIGTQSGMEYMADITAPRFIPSSELTGSPVYTIGRFIGSSVWGMSRYEMVVNDPYTLTAPKRTPPIYLTAFHVNGIRQDLRQERELSRSDLTSCSFTYACVTFRSNAEVKYQYRLEGLHDGWQPLTTERSVTFAQLGAGRFTFHVRGVLNNGAQVTETISRSFVVVPPLWDRWWFAPLMIVLILSVIMSIYGFRIRQRLALERVRLSIAADLHDDIGSVLARIANLADILVMSGSVKRRTAAGRSTKPGLPQQSAQTIADLSRELLEKMSDVVWSVDPRNDDPRRLLQRIQTYCTEVAEQHHWKLRFTTEGDFHRIHIDPQQSRAVLLVLKEALTNILKHADAGTLEIRLSGMPDVLVLAIADDGRGFEEGNLGRVNGIFNMRKRAELCGGNVNITSHPGAGTTVILTLPLKTI